MSSGMGTSSWVPVGACIASNVCPSKHLEISFYWTWQIQFQPGFFKISKNLQLGASRSCIANTVCPSKHLIIQYEMSKLYLLLGFIWCTLILSTVAKEKFFEDACFEWTYFVLVKYMHIQWRIKFWNCSDNDRGIQFVYLNVRKL